jgi:hypothetical protein
MQIRNQSAQIVVILFLLLVIADSKDLDQAAQSLSAVPAAKRLHPGSTKDH